MRAQAIGESTGNSIAQVIPVGNLAVLRSTRQFAFGPWPKLVLSGSPGQLPGCQMPSAHVMPRLARESQQGAIRRVRGASRRLSTPAATASLTAGTAIPWPRVLLALFQLTARKAYRTVRGACFSIDSTAEKIAATVMPPAGHPWSRSDFPSVRNPGSWS